MVMMNAHAESIVMRLLKDAAANGRPCPDNQTIARAIGAKSISSAARVVASLEQANFIVVDRSRNTRVVTIVATGAHTAPHPVSRGPQRADELAELVAEGANLTKAAEAMGLSRTRVDQIWNSIRARLGPQAV
jgi:tRNA C32,U32 (ribose-2'-O)-methylase TrmJ